MVRVNIEVDGELHKKAKIISVSNNKTLIQFINEAIEEKIKRGK